MFNLKELKIVEKIKSLKPKFQWLMFSKMQDYKINAGYIDMICPDKEKESGIDSEGIEAMVKDTLIREFGVSIQNSKSYPLLVDAVLHNLKKKQLESLDD